MPTPIPARVPFSPPQVPQRYDPTFTRTQSANLARAISPMVTRTAVADTTVKATDDTIVMDTTGGPLTLTLLMASQLMWLRVQIVNRGTYALVVVGTIDGMLNVSIPPGGSLTIQSDGTAWRNLATLSFYPIDPLEIAAGVTVVDPTQPFGYVTRYGAVCDSSTNNVVAIQAAIAVTESTAGGVTFFPHGPPGLSYHYAGTLVVKNAVVVRGESPNVAIVATGLSVGQFAIDLDGTINPNLEGVIVENLTVLAGLGDCIRNNNASLTTFRNLTPRNCRHGIVVTGNRAFSLRYDNVTAGPSLTGSTVKYQSHTGGGQHNWFGGFMGGNTGVYVDSASAPDSFGFAGTLFEATVAEGFLCEGSLKAIAFDAACRWEKCGSYAVSCVPTAATDRIAGLSVAGAFFNTNGTPSAINLGGGLGLVSGFLICANYADFYTSEFVTLAANVTDGLIAGNRLDTCPAIVDVIRPGVLVINNRNTAGPLGQQWNPSLTTPAAIASPTAPSAGYVQAEAQSMKTAVDAIRAILLADGFSL